MRARHSSLRSWVVTIVVNKSGYGHHCTARAREDSECASKMLQAFALQAVLLSEPTEQLNSFNLLLYMAPIATCALIPTTLLLEPASLQVAQELVMKTPGFQQLLLCNCLLAFFANLLNFLITKHTSALTLQVRPVNPPSAVHVCTRHNACISAQKHDRKNRAH